MRRDWWGRALAALIGIWVAGMIATPAGAPARHPVDLARAVQTLPDRTLVISAREAPDADSTPPARAVARECSTACGSSSRRAADELPVASVVGIAAITHPNRVELPAAPRPRDVGNAHALPPALGPPASLV